MDSCSNATSKTHWNVCASDYARKTYNPIVDTMLRQMSTKPECDKSMINVSEGDPTKFGNLLPPSCVQENIGNILKDTKAISNSPPGGYQFAREAVAKYSSIPGELEISWKNVYVTSGCSSAIEIAVRALANPHDNILIPFPGFTFYEVIAKHRDIEARKYQLLPEKSWQINLDHLESLIDERTKLLIIINPSNPCGSVFSKDHLQDIVNVAEKYHIPILADEVYEYLVFSGNQFNPLGAISKNVPVLACSGLAKRFNAPGWRCGWLIIHDRNGILAKEVVAGIETLMNDSYLCCSVIQSLLPQLLLETTEDYFAKAKSIIKNNANLLYNELSKIDGVEPKMATAAIYMMVGVDIDKFNGIDSDETLALFLIKDQAIKVMPCSALGYPNYIRIVLTPPSEIMAEICQRLTEFFLHYRKA